MRALATKRDRLAGVWAQCRSTLPSPPATSPPWQRGRKTSFGSCLSQSWKPLSASSPVPEPYSFPQRTALWQWLRLPHRRGAQTPESPAGILAISPSSFCSFSHLTSIFSPALCQHFIGLHGTRMVKSLTGGETSHPHTGNEGHARFQQKLREPLFLPSIICGPGVECRNTGGPSLLSCSLQLTWERQTRKQENKKA